MSEMRKMFKRLLVSFGILFVLALCAPGQTSNTSHYEVKVVDANGQPIAGAVIEGYRGPFLRQTGQELQPDTRATTDANGVVKFAPTNGDWLTVVAWKPGLAVDWGVCTRLSEVGAQTEAELTLSPAKALSGLVLDAARKPVPDAVVWVSAAFRPPKSIGSAQSFIPLSSRLGRKYFSARTGSDGKFRIEGLADETKFNLAVSKPGLALAQPASLASDLNPADMAFETGSSNIVLALKPSGGIEGLVVRTDTGALIKGARVNVVGSPFADDLLPSTLTGSDGAFRLSDLGPGEYQLIARVGTNQPADLISEPVSVTVGAGATNRSVKISASPGGVLEISVHDQAEDKPIAGALIYRDNPDAEQPPVTSDSGIVRLRLSPGDYQLFAVKAGYIAQPTPAKVESGKTNLLSISLAAAVLVKIQGTVIDPDGKPAARAILNLFPFQQGESRTDAKGRFTLSTTPSQFGGMQNIQRLLIARDLVRNLAAALEIEDDATNVTLRLAPASTLAGRVTDSSHKPIAGVQVELMLLTEHFNGAFGAAARTDAAGRFEIRGLPPSRRYGVTVSAKGYGRASRNMDAGETNARRVDLEEIELPLADQHIAGVVLDADNKPVAGARIYGYGGDQPQIMGQTDAKGNFTFDHVCTGPINLSANIQHGGVNSNGSVTAQGGETNITIQLGVSQMSPMALNSGSRKFTGTVVGADGKPSPRIVVEMFPYSGAQQRTDAEGRFTLGLNPDQFPSSMNAQHVLIGRDLDHNLAAAFDIEEGVTNATLKLEPGLTLGGQITDLNGKAITNAQAQAMFRTERMGSSLGAPVRVDANGRYEIKALPPGRRYSVNVTAPGFGQDNRDVDAPEAGTLRVDLEPFALPAADQRIAGVVLDPDDNPVRGAWIYTYGDKQPNHNGQTDAKGRFSFDKVCAGAIRISANTQRGASGSAVTEGGDTNITVRLGSSPASMQTEAPRVSLKGKSLPDLAPCGFAPADAPEGKPVLLLVIDAEQRPCRRTLRLLAEQAPALKAKGLSILVLHSGAMTEEAFADWKKEAALPFPVGRAKTDPEKTRAAWGAAALPWLILTDKAHRVIAEGFALDELEGRVADLRD